MHPRLILIAVVAALVLAGAPSADAAPTRTESASVAAKRQLTKLRSEARRACAGKRSTTRACRLAKRRVQRAVARVSGSTSKTAAPVLRVSGQTLSWTRVSTVDRYVLATTVPGSSTTYRVVTGTSTTPPSVPGKTVNYGLRTDVASSRWSAEVKISYPAATSEPVAPAPTATATPVATATPSSTTVPTVPAAPTAFQPGITSGSDTLNEVRYLKGLAPKLVRVEFDLDELSLLGQAVAAHAANGTRVLPLASFESTLPTVDQARGLGEWARQYGPNGTFWQGRTDGHLAIREIEFGNETNMGYQYGDNWDVPSYAERARNYALRFKDAQEAIRAANPNVKLLAQGDDGGTGSSVWIDNMVAAVPDLGSRVGGWTVHPYGPRTKWEPRFDRMATQHARRGLPADLPIHITEWGLATDNGRCLSDNYGWDKCMTYAAAATALNETVAGMRAKLGSRLAALFIYQGKDQRATGLTTEREHYFGALKTDLTDKGVYGAAVRAFLATS